MRYKYSKEEAKHIDHLLQRLIDEGDIKTMPLHGWTNQDQDHLDLLNAHNPDFVYHDSGMYLEITPLGRSFRKNSSCEKELKAYNKERSSVKLSRNINIVYKLMGIVGMSYLVIDVIIFLLTNKGILDHFKSIL